MDFRKSFYILPNLFTLASVLSGFAALALTASAPVTGPSEPDTDLYLAALAICFGFFFDTVDGRVARLPKTQPDLGRDLDSLADVITFGAAPALLMYRWGLTSFGRWGIFIAGLFVCAGALRLARFNVLERRAQLAAAAALPRNAPIPGAAAPSKFTVGLSIPPAASVLVFMVIVTHHAGQYRALSEGSTAAVVLVLSVLMVSRIRFRSFKDLRMNGRTIGVFALIFGAIGATQVTGFRKGFIFLVLVSAYIGLGLAEEVIFFRKRRAEARNANNPPEQQEDQEVLRELGAFDEDGENGGAHPASTPATQKPGP